VVVARGSRRRKKVVVARGESAENFGIAEDCRLAKKYEHANISGGYNVRAGTARFGNRRTRED
jgi:hypothetical protein